MELGLSCFLPWKPNLLPPPSDAGDLFTALHVLYPFHIALREDEFGSPFGSRLW